MKILSKPPVRRQPYDGRRLAQVESVTHTSDQLSVNVLMSDHMKAMLEETGRNTEKPRRPQSLPPPLFVFSHLGNISDGRIPCAYGDGQNLTFHVYDEDDRSTEVGVEVPCQQVIIVLTDANRAEEHARVLLRRGSNLGFSDVFVVGLGKGFTDSTSLSAGWFVDFAKLMAEHFKFQHHFRVVSRVQRACMLSRMAISSYPTTFVGMCWGLTRILLLQEEQLQDTNVPAAVENIQSALRRSNSDVQQAVMACVAEKTATSRDMLEKMMRLGDKGRDVQDELRRGEPHAIELAKRFIREFEAFLQDLPHTEALMKVLADENRRIAVVAPISSVGMMSKFIAVQTPTDAEPITSASFPTHRFLPNTRGVSDVETFVLCVTELQRGMWATSDEEFITMPSPSQRVNFTSELKRCERSLVQQCIDANHLVISAPVFGFTMFRTLPKNQNNRIQFTKPRSGSASPTSQAPTSVQKRRAMSSETAPKFVPPTDQTQWLPLVTSLEASRDPFHDLDTNLRGVALQTFRIPADGDSGPRSLALGLIGPSSASTVPDPALIRQQIASMALSLESVPPALPHLQTKAQRASWATKISIAGVPVGVDFLRMFALLFRRRVIILAFDAEKRTVRQIDVFDGTPLSNARPLWVVWVARQWLPVWPLPLEPYTEDSAYLSLLAPASNVSDGSLPFSGSSGADVLSVQRIASPVGKVQGAIRKMFFCDTCKSGAGSISQAPPFKYICFSCAESCHDGHMLSPAITLRGSIPDCGCDDHTVVGGGHPSSPKPKDCGPHHTKCRPRDGKDDQEDDDDEVAEKPLKKRKSPVVVEVDEDGGDLSDGSMDSVVSQYERE